MMQPIQIMLVDDHNLVRAGIRSLLKSIPGVEIVAETYNGHNAMQMIEMSQPDIVLMDISLPDMNGLDVASQIKTAHPAVKVIFLSMYANEEYVLQAMQVGAAGYLLKDASFTELELAIKAVTNGEAYLSPAISKRVIEGYKQRVYRIPSEKTDAPASKDLTPRQSEILTLIAEGFTTKEIAQKLEISVKTVEAHRSQLMKDLDIHDIAGLVRYAIRIGLVSAE